ncbi:hypothetical protein ACSS6W_002473 [Trichoderma asperelloides]
MALADESKEDGVGHGAAVDVEKAELASTTDVSTDVPLNHNKLDQSRFSIANAANLSLDDVEPTDVQIRGLTITVDTSPSWLDPSTYPELFSAKLKAAPRIKTLLHSVDANFKPGTLTAIIGGSGSGKTTLLNNLAERVVSSRLSQQGLATFNGRVGVNSVRHAYVMQQDILLPTLTVRETLRYSADLRLPSSTSAEERERVVEEVIRELGLKECANTRIGNSQHRGCSGGEKRRVSIGVQLLANPSVLFLDEPTTGLDATSAFQLVRTLKSLAQKGRAVITTIHQPRSEIWDLFDNLVILSKGSPVFSGPVSECLPWFKELGYQLPLFVNPAEFVIDIAAVDNRTTELEEETSARLERLKAAWKIESESRFPPIQDIAVMGKRKKRSQAARHAGFFRQVRILTDRTLKVTYRDPLGMTASLLEAVIMGVVVGYLFFNLGRDQAGIRSREGLLYIATGLQGYLILMFETYRLTIDMPTFDRESSEHCVDAVPYILSRRLARLITEDFPVPFLFSLILYFMAGFDHNAAKFFTFFSIGFVNHYVCFYTFGAYCGNEFQGSFYDCPESGGPSNPACLQYTGEFIMSSLGFPRNWVARPIVCLASFVVFFFILSAVGLHYIKVEMTIARSRVSDTDLSAGKEKMTARSIAEVRTIDVELENFSLDLDKRALNGKKLPRKNILQPINVNFQAGTLNIIMGPSGSGKTSLLNSMALRLRNSIGTHYHPSGKMSFNGAVPSSSVVRSVCSYVCQDDDALLPSLTVRETLRFSAALRLPSFMSKEEKYQRAEEVLMKMGLKDCADNLIGNDLVKGISGGEKRRVSIAVQVLTDPRILLLDEPTSGLDAFTASSIMEVLQGLANEGRTLILTIHQPRSDLFKHFGNVLLLARGGSPAYAGPAKDMLNYFSRQGYQCPQHSNPADFALDMITVDLQRDDREAESRERVGKLIEHWKKHSSGEDVSRLPGIIETDEMDEKKTSHDDINVVASKESERPRKSFNKANLSTPAELGALVHEPASLATALPLLLHRAAINTRRQPQLIMARTMQVVGLAIIFALFFAPLHHDYYAVQNWMGYIQEVGAFYFVGMLQNVAIYPTERDVFYREDDDGVYSVDAFLLSYTILEVPFEILSCLIFGILMCLAVGLPRTATMYFVSVFGCFGIVSCGESLGIMFNTVVSHIGFAVNIMGMFLSIANAMAGILSIDAPKAFKALNYLSPIQYSLRAIAPYALRNEKFYCKPEQLLADGTCPIETGKQVLQLYDFDDNPVVNVAALAGCVVVYRLLAWLLLKLVRARWSNSRK